MHGEELCVAEATRAVNLLARRCGTSGGGGACATAHGSRHSISLPQRCQLQSSRRERRRFHPELRYLKDTPIRGNDPLDPPQGSVLRNTVWVNTFAVSVRQFADGRRIPSMARPSIHSVDSPVCRLAVVLLRRPLRLTGGHEPVGAAQHDTLGRGVRLQRFQGRLGAGLHRLGVFALH